MKRTAYMMLTAVALVLMTLVPAYCQKTSATVNTPFSFAVDDVRMPASEYLIDSPSEKVISIQRVGGSEVKVTLTASGSSAARTTGPAKLVFHKYGNAYFVAAAWMPNSDHAREFASANEIQMARNGGQDLVELALLAAK